MKRLFGLCLVTVAVAGSGVAQADPNFTRAEADYLHKIRFIGILSNLSDDYVVQLGRQICADFRNMPGLDIAGELMNRGGDLPGNFNTQLVTVATAKSYLCGK